MATIVVTPDQIFVVGSSYRLLARIDKDGGDWDLTGATAEFFLKKPDGTVVTHAAVVSVALTGEVYVDLTTAAFDVAGLWKGSWRVTSGSVVQETQPIPLPVVDAP